MSGNEALRPGEVDLEAPDEPVVETPAVEEPEAVVEAAAEEEAPAEEAAAEEPPPAPEPEKRRPTGAVGELMELRAEAKILREQMNALRADPAIQRLTPEIRQAIADGRIVVTPPKTNIDTERERLADVAKELGLLRDDGTPDVDAAQRVDRVIQRQVQSSIAPMVEQTRQTQHAITRDKANANIEAAVAAATANGWDAEFVRTEFQRAAAVNPQLLVDPNVAMEVWDSTVGKLHRAGKINAAAPKPAADSARKPAAAPIISESTNRRGAAGGLTLTPALARVYKDNGIDPSKSYSTKLGKVDMSQGVSLED